MVDNVKGIPKASAACAANISPSACCIPVRPVGAKARHGDILVDHF